MGSPELQLSELIYLATHRRLSSVFGAARDQPIIIVDLPSGGVCDSTTMQDSARHELGILPVVIVGVGAAGHPAASLVDVIAEPDLRGGELAAIVDGVTRRPLASTALCLLLRHGGARTIAAGLVAESTTYSMLLGGPEFAGWFGSRRPSVPLVDAQPAVLVERVGNTRTVLLNRPHRHNAVDLALSEGLLEALTQVLAEGLTDPALRIVLRGNGPSFSSGGDLSGFGAFPDPAMAHAVRLSRSSGQVMSMMSDRIEAHLHGHCIGAGIELAAFASRVVASSDTRIALPELSLGLVPGAGGTVSMPLRIGRHRTALLALTGLSLDAITAHSWGLVDCVE